MDHIVAKVAERLKLSKEETGKLRTTARVAGVTSEEGVERVLAGMRRGQKSTATAVEALSRPVEYPSRVDECPICYAHMAPVTIAGNRPAFFCAVHNVCMPTIE